MDREGILEQFDRRGPKWKSGVFEFFGLSGFILRGIFFWLGGEKLFSFRCNLSSIY